MQGGVRQGILPVEPIYSCGEQPPPGWTERNSDARLLCDAQTRQRRIVINDPSRIHGFVIECRRAALEPDRSFAGIRTRDNPITGEPILESNVAARRTDRKSTRLNYSH